MKRMQWLAGAVLLMMLSAAASAASIEVVGVAASNPGQPQNIPAGLAAYKKVLSGTMYGKFDSAGSQVINVPDGGKGSARIGQYAVEIAVRSSGGGKTSFDVTIKDGGKPIGQPAAYNNTAAGSPVSIIVGDQKAPTILIITAK